jgi:hypothetical protein
VRSVRGSSCVLGINKVFCVCCQSYYYYDLSLADLKRSDVEPLKKRKKEGKNLLPVLPVPQVSLCIDFHIRISRAFKSKLYLIVVKWPFDIMVFFYGGSLIFYFKSFLIRHVFHFRQFVKTATYEILSQFKRRQEFLKRKK